MKLNWLKTKPKYKKGVTWGIPWKKGELPPDEIDSLIVGDHPEKIDTWVNAQWPDGSIKWTGHAGVIQEKEIEYRKDSAYNDKGTGKLLAEEKYNGIFVNTDHLEFRFSNRGSALIDWIKFDGKIKTEKIRPVCRVTGRNQTVKLNSSTIKQNGTNYCIVQSDCDVLNERKEVIEKIRFFFKIFKESDSIDISVTNFVVQEENFEGIGLQADLLIEGEPWNRQVYFAGDEGVYNEPAQLLLSRRHAVSNDAYVKQCAGEVVEITDEQKIMLDHAKQNAIWNDFMLSQKTDNCYYLEKRTREGCSKVKIGEGKHSKGLLYVGGRNGGVSFAIKDFWQKHPSALIVHNLNEKRQSLIAWFWSPTAEPMEFKHYSDRDHMLSAYEGFEEVRSSAKGIANTSHMTISIFDSPAAKEVIWQYSLENEEPSHLVVEPEQLHSTKALGLWSLYSNDSKEYCFIENQMETLLNFYQNEVKQRNWYGYWNYGDFMHTYDPYRHEWRYDMGGYAWQNTELVPNMWLWQSFLRTGKAELFYLAEAMSIHTAEVDRYHFGEYEGLGSRHNVLHWGDSCKEVRISMAGLHRYYYYLTCDPRMEDILEEVKDNEKALKRLEPLREFYKTEDEKIPTRVGPDWSSLVSNWFTQWERTGDRDYLNNIIVGIEDIKNTPHRLLSGPSYMFDPDTKHMYYKGTGNVGGYHMIISFGAPQVWMELAYSLDNEEWKKMLAEFGRFYALSEEEKLKESKDILNNRHFSWPMFATGMMAWAARYYNDPELAKEAWRNLLDSRITGMPLPISKSIEKVTIWKNVEEIPWISTNCASQWCLNTILCLELIPEYLGEILRELNLNQGDDKK